MATILLADDDPAIRTLISAALTAGGHSVYAACNGLEAVALFRSAPDDVDLVLMDMEMPVMRGDEAIARIRETRPGVKIICMSGYTTALPANLPFLPKPFLPKALLEFVASVLRSDPSDR